MNIKGFLSLPHRFRWGGVGDHSNHEQPRNTPSHDTVPLWFKPEQNACLGFRSRPDASLCIFGGGDLAGRVVASSARRSAARRC